jgi:hypothetical protein
MPCHSPCLAYNLANEYFLFARKFAPASIAEIKTQSVGLREVSARSGIMNLSDIFDLKSPAKDNRLKGAS